MKCPQCGFVSSNKRDLCPKCSLDLRSHKRSLGLPVSYPSLALDELRAKEAGTQAASAKTPPAASSAAPAAAAPQPAAQTPAPKPPEPQAKKTSFLDRVLGNKTQTQTAPPPVSVQSVPPQSAPTQSAPRQPAAKAPLGETKPTAKSPQRVNTAPISLSVEPLPPIELGELEVDPVGAAGDSSSLHVTQPIDPSEPHLLSDQSKHSNQSRELDLSDPIEFEKLIGQLETAGQAPEVELLPPKSGSENLPTTESSDDFSLGASDTESRQEDIWGADETGEDEFASDPSNSGPLVAPEVLEFFDDEAMLEKQLDAMLEDTQLNITTVKLERPPEPPKQTAAESEAADDEFEFSFEFEADEETETGNAVEAADAAEEENVEDSSEESEDFESPRADTAVSEEAQVSQSFSGEAVASDLSALPFIDLSALLEATPTAEPTAEPMGEPPVEAAIEFSADLNTEPAVELAEEPLEEEQPLTEESEREEEAEHPAVEQALELQDLISAIAKHYGVTASDIHSRLADLGQKNITPHSVPETEAQPDVIAVAAEDAPPAELIAEAEPTDEPESDIENFVPLASEEIPQLISAPSEETASDQKKNFAEETLDINEPAIAPVITAELLPSAVVPPDIPVDMPADISADIPLKAPQDIPDALWQNVEQELLSYVADEVEINSGDLVKREVNGTIDMYFALVNEELTDPAKHRTLSDQIKPAEVKIDSRALNTALSTYTKKARIVEQQAREAKENRAPQSGQFSIPSHLKPIPLWRRGIAAAIDCGICSLLGALLCGIIFVPVEIRKPLQSALLSASLPDIYLLLTVLPSFIATAVLAWVVLTTAAIAGKSQTFGQQFIGASVTDLSGDPVSLTDSLLWSLCQITTLLSCGLGLLPALGSSGRTLHDRLAGVLVARFDMEEFFAAAQSSAPITSTDEILDFRT